MISEDDVPDLLIRDLPPALHEKLKDRAERNRRSLSAEVVAVLDEVLHAPEPLSLEVIDALRVRGRRPLDDEMLEQVRRERP